MKTYKIQDKEAGNVIVRGIKRYSLAMMMVQDFEEEDKKEGNYTPNFYEIKEEEKEPFSIDLTIPLLGIVIILLLGISSCSREGYGCKGTGKYITRVR